MAKQPPMEPAHDDGTWFLEAVGAKEAASTPLEAVDDLTRENAIPGSEDTDSITPGDADGPSRDDQEIDLVSFDGDPGTSTSTFAPIPDPPPPPNLGDTSEAPVVVDEADELDKMLLAPALRTGRRFRWPVAIFLIAIIIAIGIAVIWFPRAADQEALAIRQSNYDATLAVRTYLPTSQAALDSVTNPASSTDDVAAAIPTISALSSHATTLSDAAREPLPTQLPFFTSGAIEQLGPLQQRSSILASETSEIARRLGHGYVYRTSVPELLATGDLPSEATTQEINTIAVDLASSLASDAEVLGGLPNDPSFAVVLEAASQAVDRYALWQDEYLAALAAGDPELATTLVDELTTLRSDLNALNTVALVTFRSEMDERILSLADQLDVHLTDLAR